jgi:hypothetical protein
MDQKKGLPELVNSIQQSGTHHFRKKQTGITPVDTRTQLLINRQTVLPYKTSVL